MRYKRVAGIIVPSYALGSTASDRNLVLWTWGDKPPHKITVFDPGGKLPKNLSSWL